VGTFRLVGKETVANALDAAFTAGYRLIGLFCMEFISLLGSDSFRSGLMFCWLLFYFLARSPSSVGRSL